MTGLLYVDEGEPDLHGVNGTTAVPLNQLPFEALCPGAESSRGAPEALPLTALARPARVIPRCAPRPERVLRSAANPRRLSQL